MSAADRPEIRQAWRCGEYRIELAAPRLWVVTRERARRSSGPSKVAVEATAGSLVTANGLVSKLHRKHCAERSLIFHVASLGVVVTGALGLTTIEPALAIPSVLAATLLAGRTLLRTIDLFTGRSWEQVSQTYQ